MLAAAGGAKCAARARPKPACCLLPQVGVPAWEAWRLGCNLRGADGYVDYPALFRVLRGPSTRARRDFWSGLAGRPASTPLAAAPAALVDAQPCAGVAAAPARPWLPWESAEGACDAERQGCSGAGVACTAPAHRPGVAPAACLPQVEREAQRPAHGRADDAWADAAVVRAAAVAAASAAAQQGDAACAQGQGWPATACVAAPPGRQEAWQPGRRPQSATAGDSCRQAAFERARYDAAACPPAAPRLETVRGAHAPYWYALAAPGREEAFAAAWRPLGDASQFRTCFSRARAEHRPQFLVHAGRGLPAESMTARPMALLQRPASALACAGRQAAAGILAGAAEVGTGAAAHPAAGAGRARPQSALADARRGTGHPAAGPGTAAGSMSGWDSRRGPPSRGRAVPAQAAEGALPRAMVPAALRAGHGRASDVRAGEALARDMLVVRALA